MAHERALDLVVWGASGYTGRLTARAVAEAAPAGLRWAVAGRDRERVEAVRQELSAEAAILIGDAHDEGFVRSMARRARVIVSTVGPYERHGTPLVRACVQAGTDHVDASGEVLWMRRTIDAFHRAAQGTGARIVHACGFAGVPADLGTRLLQEEAMRRHGRPCHDVLHVFGPMTGGVSGGTANTALESVRRAANDPFAREAQRDPDLLAPGAAPSPSVADPWWPRWEERLGVWTLPFALARVDTPIVRRTRMLLGEPWGEEIRYRERLRAANLPVAAASAAVAALGEVALRAAPVRRLARRALSGPGSGPGEEARRRGSFRSMLLGRVPGVLASQMVAVESDLDPGYGATARMLREVGLALAYDEVDVPGGVLTPATLGATLLADRLGRAGVRFRHVRPRAGPT